MESIQQLNPLARTTWARLIAEHPSWEPYFGAKGKNLEVAVPAPSGSTAGHLLIQTAKETDVWIGFSPPYMRYPVDSAEEMLSIINDILEDRLCVVIVTEDGLWVETTLIRRGQLPSLNPAQIAKLISWSGRYDRTVVGASVTKDATQ